MTGMVAPHSQTQRLLRSIDANRVNILIVEDNDASRRLVLELLRATGFSRVYFARDAEEAVPQIVTLQPDLILMDWELPGRSGLDLLHDIRSSALETPSRFPNPDVPIVMLTARQRQRDVTAARNAGINQFVVKPFSTASLLKAVVNALTKKRRFIVTQTFTGPDRRRRRAAQFPGLMRREGDVVSGSFNEALALDMKDLRAALASPAGRDPAALSQMTAEMTRRLLEIQVEAHGNRLRLIEQATHSLNEYVQYFGHEAEAEVLDVHFDALIRLNDVPYAAQEEAMNIVTQLKRLVSRRRNRKAS